MNALRGLAFVAALLSTHPAFAGETVHETRESVLGRFFQGSDKVAYEKLVLDDADAKAFRERLGYELPRREYVIYVGRTGESIDGYAVIDNEMGKHRLITYAVQVQPGGRVREVALMIYREDVGGQVREKPFMRQFAGKSLNDPVRLGADVDGISGATISSRALCIGVKRALWIVDRLTSRPKKP